MTALPFWMLALQNRFQIRLEPVPVPILASRMSRQGFSYVRMVPILGSLGPA